MSKTFAVLKGNIVLNIIVAETVEDAELVAPGCVEYNSENPAGINWIYNFESKTFTAPQPIDQIIE